jgi:hypothetical protein
LSESSVREPPTQLTEAELQVLKENGIDVDELLKEKTSDV